MPLLPHRKDRYLRSPHLCISMDGDLMLDCVAWNGAERESIERFSLTDDGVPSEGVTRHEAAAIETAMRTADGLLPTPDIAEEDRARDGGVIVNVMRLLGQSRVTLSRGGRDVLVWQGAGIAAAPALACDDKGGAWIAFHHDVREDTAQGDVSKWIELRYVNADGVVYAPAQPMRDRNRDMEGEEQGFEFPSLILGADGAVRIYGRGSHAFYKQDLNATGWTARTLLAEGSWGCRGRRVAALRDGARVWTARREREGIVIDAEDAPRGGTPELVAAPPQKIAALTRGLVRAELDLHDFARDDDRKTLFGDIHQHSAHSDGCGAASEPYVRARDRYEDDFCALSDHESFLGKRIGPGEWGYLQSVADQHQMQDEFATLYAFEWTGRAHPGPGHKVIYSPHRTSHVLSRDTLPEGKDLVARAREEKRLAVPHHVGWTGANEDAHDEHVQPVWEICSCHGCYESFAHELGQRGDLRDQMVDAVLRRGHRFGFIASSDGHGLLWHHGVARKRDPFRTGLTAVQATACTREAILSALSERRCYATSGAKILLDVRADGAPMGSLLHGRKMRSVVVRVKGTSLVTSIELVGPDGVLASQAPEEEEAMLRAEIDAPYVYARIKQADGEMAWSSPIFTI